MAWATFSDARRFWPDAPNIDAEIMNDLLAAAFEQCEAYAPVLVAGEVVPKRYVHANVLQARELWAAASRDGDVVGGTDTTYAVRVRPLGATVRALLRPPSPRRVVG